MYSWEIPFSQIVKKARKKEIDKIEMSQYLRGFYFSTMVFTERSTLFLAILACIFQGYAITADLVFSMATFFNVLQLSAAIFYPLAVSTLAEALVCVVIKKMEWLGQGQYFKFTIVAEICQGVDYELHFFNSQTRIKKI